MQNLYLQVTDFDFGFLVVVLELLFDAFAALIIQAYSRLGTFFFLISAYHSCP